MAVQIADVVIVRGEKALLVQQRKQSAYGLWSFPGGHVDEGETIEQAVIRETREEIGVELIRPQFFKTYTIENQGATLDIHTFTGTIIGDIRIKEDELLAFGWFTIDELATKNDLRHSVVIEQARDVLQGT